MSKFKSIEELVSYFHDLGFKKDSSYSDNDVVDDIASLNTWINRDGNRPENEDKLQTILFNPYFSQRNDDEVNKSEQCKQYKKDFYNGLQKLYDATQDTEVKEYLNKIGNMVEFGHKGAKFNEQEDEMKIVGHHGYINFIDDSSAKKFFEPGGRNQLIQNYSTPIAALTQADLTQLGVNDERLQEGYIAAIIPSTILTLAPWPDSYFSREGLESFKKEMDKTTEDSKLPNNLYNQKGIIELFLRHHNELNPDKKLTYDNKTDIPKIATLMQTKTFNTVYCKGCRLDIAQDKTSNNFTIDLDQVKKIVAALKANNEAAASMKEQGVNIEQWNLEHPEKQIVDDAIFTVTLYTEKRNGKKITKRTDTKLLINGSLEESIRNIKGAGGEVLSGDGKEEAGGALIYSFTPTSVAAAKARSSLTTATEEEPAKARSSLTTATVKIPTEEEAAKRAEEAAKARSSLTTATVKIPTEEEAAKRAEEAAAKRKKTSPTTHL
jgi:hypothetical protein